MKNAMSNGAMTSMVAADSWPHWALLSVVFANNDIPNDSERFSGEFVITNGHKKLLH